MKKFFTIGYGGRAPRDLISILQANAIALIIDVRLKPQRASLGVYVKAKSPDKGIEKTLASGGIRYLSLTELGNPFLDSPDWKEQFEALMKEEGSWRIESLRAINEPFCLLCAEKDAERCHRKQIADYLLKNGYDEVEHL